MWIPGSRRHADPASYLLPLDHWDRTRAAFAQAVEQPLDSAERLTTLADEQAELLAELARATDEDAEAQLRDGDLIVENAFREREQPSCSTQRAARRENPGR